MNDPHLNLFYSYTFANELIENNLTRAWIVTLSLLSNEVRNALLSHLLDHHISILHGDDIHPITFENPSFNLQGNMNKLVINRISRLYILAIASRRIEFESEENSSKKITDTYSGSIPDGWIYDTDRDYCFLIEAKVGMNPLDSRQLLSHAEYWLGIHPNNVPNHLISITWVDVLDAIEQIQLPINQQETFLLTNFVEFLRLFGYKPFNGIGFSNLGDIPKFSLPNVTSQKNLKIKRLKFYALQPPPQFKIGAL